VNQEQLRLRIRALVGPMTGRIESAADDIGAASTERAWQQAALDWKIEAVPALREALFQPGPSVALMDAWVLLYQMSDYFERGPGKNSLGPFNAQAVAACRSMEEDLTRVAAAATVSGDVSKARAFAKRWAGEHPITTTIAAREPVLSVAFSVELGDTLTAGESAAEIVVTLDDLTRKLDLYGGQLPRQARWEVDRQRHELIDELSARQAVPLAERTVTSAERITAAVDRLAPAIEGAAHTAERTPDIIAAEHRAASEVIAAELTRAIEFAQRERLSAQQYLTAERKATVDDLRQVISVEQHALGAEVYQLSDRMVDHAMDRLERLVWTVLAIFLVGMFAGLVLIRVLFFKFTRPGGEPRPA
jgi:hypothetical protein